MDTKTINEVFQMFTHADRPDLRHPFRQGGSYFATDGMTLISLPLDAAILDYPEQAAPPASKILKDKTCNIEIALSELEAQLVPEMEEETEEKTITEKCKECMGGGEVTFTYNADTTNDEFEHELDCPICGGTGNFEKTEKVKTGRLIARRYKSFKLLGTGFAYWQLRRFIDACKIIGVEKITKIWGEPFTGNGFAVGGFTFVVMPVILSADESDVTEIKI